MVKMKKNYIISTLLCCLFLQQFLFAQTRYIDEVFTDDEITVLIDEEYGVNMTILAQLFNPDVDMPIVDELTMDVYMPSAAVDDVTNRPALVVLAGDGYLPRFTNVCHGTKDDIYHKALAMKWAKLGYVAILVAVRQGFNPLATQPGIFQQQLTGALTRGTQDMRSVARFLRRDVVEGNNQYNIDPEKMILWGSGAGAPAAVTNVGYATTLEEYETPNYIIQNEEGEFVNTYDNTLFGNLLGTEPGFDAAGNLSNLPANNGCFSSNYALLIAAGGVNVDTFIVQAGEPPMIQFVAANFPTVNAEQIPFNLPATGDFCCLLFTNHTYQRQTVEVGNNDAWVGVEFSDPIANVRLDYPPTPDIVDPIEGLYPIAGPMGNIEPWLFWDEELCAASPNGAAVVGNTNTRYPGASLELMNSILDEMVRYATPRACITLGLGCEGITTGLREPIVESERVAVSPNPSTGTFVFETPVDKLMETISIYTISGSLLYQTAVHHHVFTAANLDLADGMYIAKIKFEDGVASKKVIVGE